MKQANERGKYLKRMLQVMLTLCLVILMTANVFMGFSITNQLEVSSVTFDETRVVRITFNMPLDTGYTLDKSLFTASYNDRNGLNSYINNFTLNYDGSQTVLMDLNQTSGVNRTFYANGSLTVTLAENAVKASGGELFKGNELMAENAILPYRVDTLIESGGQVVATNKTILSSTEAGGNSITADIKVALADPVTAAAIVGTEVRLKSQQHLVVATATTDINGEVTLSGVTLDGTIKYLEMDGGLPQVFTVIQPDKALIHVHMSDKTTSTFSSFFDENNATVFSSLLALGYSDQYFSLSPSAVKYIFEADIQEYTELRKWFHIEKTLTLESEKITEIDLNLRDSSLYTIVEKTKEDAGTELSSIKTVYVTDNETGENLVNVNPNGNLTLPWKAEFWISNDNLSDSFSLMVTGKMNNSSDKLFVYAPNQIFQKHQGGVIRFPDSTNVSKLYDITQTTFGYADNVYEYLYFKNESETVKALSDLYIYAAYSTYAPFETNSVYELYEDADDLHIKPYKIVSIPQITAENSYYYFQRDLSDTEVLPFIATIGENLRLSVDRESIKKGETQTFKFKTGNNYNLTKIKNYSSGDIYFPTLKIEKNGQLITTTQTGEWATDALTVPGIYTATVTDSKGLVFDSGKTVTSFEVKSLKPDTPVIQSVTPGDKQVVVSWVQVADATGYEIYASTESTTASAVKVDAVGTTSSSVIISNLTNGETYYFRVLATGEINSDLSDAVSATPMPPMPNAPVLNNASLSGNDVELTWVAADNADRYKIYGKKAGGSYELLSTVSSNTTSAVLQSLDKGFGYTFKVTAVNLTGEGISSNEVYYFYATVPGAPVSVVAKAGDGKATLTVTAPLENGGSELKGYNVTILPTNETHIYATTASSIEVKNLTNNVKYSFSVSAYNTIGSGNATVSNEVMPYEPRGGGDDKSGGSGGGGGTSQGSSTEATTEKSGVSVWVDGVEEKIGTQAVSVENNVKKTVVSVDEQQLIEKLGKNPENSTVTLRDTQSSGTFVGEFKGSTIEILKAAKGVVEMVSDFAEYALPVEAIDWSEYDLKELTVTVEMKKVSGSITKLPGTEAGEILGDSVEFEVHIFRGDEELSIQRFNQFIERKITVPANRQITTAIVYGTDGSYRSVPTEVNVSNGQYSAKVNSLTNSRYMLIWNPMTFEDMTGHWGEKNVNELGSRLVVSGVGDNKYAPDASVSEAEYVTALVKSLGLPVDKRIGGSKWYDAYLTSAKAFGILKSNEAANPNQAITRQEAAKLIERAMSLTKIDINLSEDEQVTLLSSFEDEELVSAEAQKAMALCVKYDIINGRYQKIAPQENMTRAEMAEILLKFLKAAELI